METKAKAFPTLRGLMAKYGLTQKEMAKIMGKSSYSNFGQKLNLQKEFSFNEMKLINKYFLQLGESCSIQEMFFDWM